jgi:hypothetical protein
MSPLVNFTWRIGARLHQTRRLIIPALCALFLVLGGAVIPLRPHFAPVRLLTASVSWAGRSVPLFEREVALRSGSIAPNDIGGGPPLP